MEITAGNTIHHLSEKYMTVPYYHLEKICDDIYKTENNVHCVFLCINDNDIFMES